ncbi:hypothetical protein DMENIID0001_093310 [Sergentomyia squamirostris]
MDLLHPNLLSNAEIVAQIKQRHLNIPNLDNMDREELVRVYNNFILPQPCRRPRNRGAVDGRSNNADETEFPENGSLLNRDLKRKHERITFSEEEKKHEMTNCKIKRTYDAATCETAIQESAKRTLPERSPPQNPSKRKKITWP